jgi:hypothetical protein
MHTYLGICTACLVVLAAAMALLATCGTAQQTTVTIQTGRTLTANDGSSVVYNSTFDTSITTQYIDSWNNMNGITVRKNTPVKGTQVTLVCTARYQ